MIVRRACWIRRPTRPRLPMRLAGFSCATTGNALRSAGAIRATCQPRTPGRVTGQTGAPTWVLRLGFASLGNRLQRVRASGSIYYRNGTFRHVLGRSGSGPKSAETLVFVGFPASCEDAENPGFALANQRIRPLCHLSGCLDRDEYRLSLPWTTFKILPQWKIVCNPSLFAVSLATRRIRAILR